MNSRKKAQKKGRLVITSQHGQVLWRGAALRFCSSIGWQQATPANGSRGHHLRILSCVPTTQQRCVSIVSIFASFAPFCGY
jgi:hypothetical protein